MVWCASIVRMRRLAIWTGWSFAPKRRALHPSINRLTNASTRSMRSPLHLYHFRTDEDDGGRYVDPREHGRPEGDRPVHTEDTEAARNDPERDLRDLPQHGGYQRREAERAAPDAGARDEAVHREEGAVAHHEAEDRRERTRGERDGERDDGQDDENPGESEGIGISADEPALPSDPEDHGQRLVDRTVDGAGRDDCADDTETQ